MREHIKADEPFVREDVPVGEALERFVGEGQDYKVELIEDLVRDADRHPSRPSASTPTARSPTCAAARTRPSTKRIKAVQAPVGRRRLLARRRDQADAHARVRDGVLLERRTSTSTSSGSSRRARDDHRKLGPQLDLFMFSELAPGLGVLAARRAPRSGTRWSSSGREHGRPRGYTEVKTPQLYDSRAVEDSPATGTSTASNMFFTESEDRHDGAQADELPGPLPALHARSATPTATCRSAIAEPGLLHRHEPSGTLHGLLRVRHFTQDDAHIFCTEEQIEDEVRRLPRVRVRDLYELFGLEPRLELSTRPDAADRHRRAVGPRRGERCGARSRRMASSTTSTRATAPSTAPRSTST